MALGRLDTKVIDLYMIHWPNPRIPIKETMKAMEDLVKKGKIRHIGVSNFSVKDLKEAQDAMSSQEIVSNQVEYNLATRGVEDELIPFCKKQKITIVAVLASVSRSGEQEKGRTARQDRGEIWKNEDSSCSKLSNARRKCCGNPEV